MVGPPPPQPANLPHNKTLPLVVPKLPRSKKRIFILPLLTSCHSFLASRIPRPSAPASAAETSAVWPPIHFLPSSNTSTALP